MEKDSMTRARCNARRTPRPFTRTALALAAGLAIGAGAIAAEGPVKIGLLSTLSGGGAGLGIDVRDGFLLALEEAGEGANVEVIVEDDQRKPDVAVRTADRMLQSEKVDIPLRFLSNSVVCAPVSFGLNVSQIFSDMNRHGFQSELVSSLESGMSSDDRSVLVNDDRLTETKLLD